MKQYLDQQGVEYFWNKIQQNFANLSSNGKIPAHQLPSYVDDVLECGSLSSFPETGEEGKIYVALDTNLTYRWGGSTYVEISPSIGLGETSSTAYPGSKGKQLATELEEHIANATKQYTDLSDAIAAEKVRAQNSENENRGLIDKNTEDIAKLMDKDSGSLADEIIRAKTAEQAIQNNLTLHVNDKSNPHSVTKSQIGLGAVDNTSDLDKPISLLTQQALNKKADADKYLPLTGGELTGNLTSPKYIKTGGTSQQILLANGDVATAISQDVLNLILV